MDLSPANDAPRRRTPDFGQGPNGCAGLFRFAQRCQVFAGAREDADRLGRFTLVVELLEQVPGCSMPAERAVVATLVHEVAHRFLRAFCGRPAAFSGQAVCTRVLGPAEQLASTALLAISAAHTRPGTRLTGIAAEARVSRWTLSRALNGILRRGFPDCVDVFRVLRAAALLRATRLSVKEIAVQAGYAQTSALDDHFKAWLHMTPTEFRAASKALGR
jgi:AraC-like DNA-binding protein